MSEQEPDDTAEAKRAPEEPAELEKIVEAVEAGTDDIPVPEVAIREVTPDPKEKHDHGKADLWSKKAESANTDSVNLWEMIREMSAGERVKLAMRGNRTARNVLVMDKLQMVRVCVLNNPRITEEEVIIICKNRSIDLMLLQKITMRRDWMKKYEIRLALTTNPKTQLGTAIKLVKTLNRQDLRQIAKSKNIPQAVCTVAKRTILQRKA